MPVLPDKQSVGYVSPCECVSDCDDVITTKDNEKQSAWPLAFMSWIEKNRHLSKLVLFRRQTEVKYCCLKVID